jgi:S-adenosylmethionine/arginine decarboxylase-like enzyme
MNKELEKVYEKYFEITAKFYDKEIDKEIDKADFFDIVEEVEQLLGFELTNKTIERFAKIGE